MASVQADDSTQNRPLTPPGDPQMQARRFPVSPLLLGVLLGAALVTLLIPGGYDGRNYFLRPWYPQTTAPAPVHLLLAPLNLLPFEPPLRWTALVLLTVLIVRAASWAWEVRWWVAMLSVPFWWTLWLGQIEALVVAGGALGWLVIQRRWPAGLMGLAGLLLLVKFQAGWGLAALFGWWLWRDRGWRAMLAAASMAAGLLLLSLVIYPDWPALWLDSLNTLSPQSRFFNSAIFPLGLMAWPLALLPISMGRDRRARLVASATLLGSPYFANYHTLTLLSMTNRPMVTALTWLTVLPMVLFIGERYTWAQSFGWLIPVGVMALDLLAWRRSSASASRG